MAVTITLTFLNGTLEGRRREFTQTEKIVVGRSSDCDLQLPTTIEFMEVSRRHCEIHIDPPSAQVRDLGSRNGTFLNDVKIGRRTSGPEETESGESAWHTVKEGDELRLGETRLRVDIAIKPEREKVGVGAGLWPFFRLWGRSAVPL